MKHRFLEITYRRGKPLAAYLYLPRNPGDKAARTDRQDSGLLIDYASDDRPIGIEITAPSKITLAALNQALSFAHQENATALCRISFQEMGIDLSQRAWLNGQNDSSQK